MHISDGILSLPVISAGFTVTAAGTAYGFRSMKYEDIPRAIFMSSIFFAVSLIHIPNGISGTHLILSGLVGLITEKAAFPVILTGLACQSLFFNWGGVAALGVNTADIALPAFFCGLFFQKKLFDPRTSVFKTAVLGFTVGAGAVFTSTAMTSLALRFSGQSNWTESKIIFTNYLPLVFWEGIITALVCLLLKKFKPDIIKTEN